MTHTPPTSPTLPSTQFPDLAAQKELLERLGLSTAPDAVFDTIATHMATDTGFLYGMVNLVLDEQNFIGLHNPPPGSEHPLVTRTMSRDHGWCPAVVKRKRALPLPNIHASPRFSGNHVVDAIGIQAYFGAPLLHPQTGIVLGTVCVVDRHVHDLQDADRIMNIVKNARDEVISTICRPADGGTS
ncbi:MAG: GAF domain-containing protein [Streptomycetaceae bacterium]|nr:GAF domain-containing protein [Streptomycetaceae bacterium]